MPQRSDLQIEAHGEATGHAFRGNQHVKVGSALSDLAASFDTGEIDDLAKRYATKPISEMSQDEIASFANDMHSRGYPFEESNNLMYPVGMLESPRLARYVGVGQEDHTGHDSVALGKSRRPGKTGGGSGQFGFAFVAGSVEDLDAEKYQTYGPRRIEFSVPRAVEFVHFASAQREVVYDIRDVTDSSEIDMSGETHGEGPGHPFRGNQYTEGVRGARVRELANITENSLVSRASFAIGMSAASMTDDQRRMDQIRPLYRDILKHIDVLKMSHGIAAKFDIADEPAPDGGPMPPAVDNLKRVVQELRLHTQLANQPQSILDHMKANGYSIRIDYENSKFDVGGVEFSEGAHVKTLAFGSGPEVVLRGSVLHDTDDWKRSPMDSVAMKVMAHEYGHVSIELLSSRLAEAGGRMYDPVSDIGPIKIRDAAGQITGSQKFSETAIEYHKAVGNAMSDFTFATIKEGGLTPYSEAYAKIERAPNGIKLVDTVYADPSVTRGWQAPGTSVQWASHSTSRAAGENFSEWMSELHARSLHQSPTKFSWNAFKESMASRHPDKPKQLKAFMVLAKEVIKKRPIVKVLTQQQFIGRQMKMPGGSK